MVNVEKSALGAFEEQRFSIAPGLLYQRRHVGHHRLDVVCDRERSVERFAQRHDARLEIVHEHEVVIIEHRLELGREALGIKKILHPQRATRDFVFVCRTDAAARRADARLAHRRLSGLIQRDMVRQHQRTRG